MPRKTPRSLAAYLKANPHLTHEVLARRLGVTAPYISMLATGKRTPGLHLALRITAETGVPVEALSRKSVAA